MTDIDAALGEVLARELAGFESLTRVERLSAGASQETYRIEVETSEGARVFALRRAAGGITGTGLQPGSPGLPTEAELMRAAGAAGVPEPEVIYVFEPEDGVGDAFLMDWLDGETLGARINRSPELADVRDRLAYQCGEILARIHAIDLDAAGLRDRLDELSPEAFVRQMWERYQEYESPQPMIDYGARWLLEHLPDVDELTLVHNDFRNGNFMVTPDGINAVLDWEVAHIGDPMRDLGWICTNSWRFGGDGPVGGFGSYEDLFAGYEAASGRPVDRDHVKFWEVFGSFWWAVGCLTFAEHYRNGPDKTVERPAVGRRTSECQVDMVNLIMPGPVELVPAIEPPSSSDLPDVAELLRSVTEFLRDDVMATTQGRTQFLSRVASNTLDIVDREFRLGGEHLARERQRLNALVGDGDEILDLRWRLVNGLRDGNIALDTPGLAKHLRTTVVNQIAIDQPRYSGFKTAIDNS